MAVHKLIDLSRRSRIRQEIRARNSGSMDKMRDAGPPPDFLVEFNDQIDYLGQVLDDDASQIVSMARQGFPTAEIARSLGISQRTVQRKLALIAEVWTGFGKSEIPFQDDSGDEA